MFHNTLSHSLSKLFIIVEKTNSIQFNSVRVKKKYIFVLIRAVLLMWCAWRALHIHGHFHLIEKMFDYASHAHIRNSVCFVDFYLVLAYSVQCKKNSSHWRSKYDRIDRKFGIYCESSVFVVVAKQQNQERHQKKKTEAIIYTSRSLYKLQ